MAAFKRLNESRGDPESKRFRVKAGNSQHHDTAYVLDTHTGRQVPGTYHFSPAKHLWGELVELADLLNNLYEMTLDSS